MFRKDNCKTLYKTLSSETLGQLDYQVNKHLREGWDLYGYQYCVIDNIFEKSIIKPIFIQVIVRYDKSKPLKRDPFTDKTEDE
jgi:hypothetical protein